MATTSCTPDRKSTRLNSSHTVIYTLSLHDALPISDINATPPKVLEYTVFITESWRHIYELGDGYYIMHPWLLLNPVILGTYVFGVPFLLWRVRTSVAAQLLLGGLGVVTVAVYVPPVA